MVEMEDASVEQAKTEKQQRVRSMWFQVESVVVMFASISLCILVLAEIIYCQMTPFSYVSMHAVIMSMSLMFLIPQGILCYNPTAFPYNRLKADQKALWHWLFMIVGFIFGMSGFMIGYTSKENSSQPHFETAHDYFGIGTTVLFLLAFALGAGSHTFDCHPFTTICHVIMSIIFILAAASTMAESYDTDWAVYVGGYAITRTTKYMYLTSFIIILIRPLFQLVNKIRLYPEKRKQPKPTHEDSEDD